MESCGICFKVRGLPNDRWEYIAPELLPEWSAAQEQLLGRLRDEQPTSERSARLPRPNPGKPRITMIGQRILWLGFGESTPPEVSPVQRCFGSVPARIPKVPVLHYVGLSLDPEETRTLNAAYHERIHRDQSNLIPLGPEAFIQTALELLA